MEPVWRWSTELACAVRVLDERDLWGTTVSAVHIPPSGRVERVPSTSLVALTERRWTADELVWRAAAGRALHLLAVGEHAGLREQRFEPLPHQLAVLERALGRDPVRLALCDE